MVILFKYLSHQDQVPTMPRYTAYVVEHVPNRLAALPDRTTFAHVYDAVPYFEGGLHDSNQRL